MSIMTSPYKHPKTGVYYFRMAVPKALIPFIGKTVFKSSLRTKNLIEAKQSFGKYLEEANKQLALAKLQLSKESDIELSERDCAIIAERWFDYIRDQIETSSGYSSILKYERDKDGHIHEFGLSDTLSLSGHEIDSASPAQLQELSNDLKESIQAQLVREGLVVSFNSDSFRRLAVSFYHYVHRLEALCRARHKRDFGYNPIINPIAEKPLSISLKEVKELKKSIKVDNPISDLFQRYKDSEIITDKSRKTLDETELQVKRLIELIGDIDVSELNRAHIVEYRDTLLQLPKSKKQSIRGLPLLKQVELVKKEGLETIKPMTVKNSLKKLSPVFSFAVELALINTNPITGVKTPKAKKKIECDKDKGYTAAEVELIFSADIFKNVNAHKPYGMACYWVPLMCRYTGARLEEMAQLDKSDIVKHQNGIHYFNIRRGEGQSVKTNSSLRHIPIPEHLIELGFLEYVEASQGRLFPDLKENKYESKSACLSSWWSNIVEKVGVSTEQPSHAFRHAFKTIMRSLEVADTISDAITGHKTKGVGASYGTVELTIKKKVIDRVPRLDLTRL